LLLGSVESLAGETNAESGGKKDKLVPLEIKLPDPVYEGTPKDIEVTKHMRKYSDKPRPPFLVPPGTKLLSLDKPISASDDAPFVGDLTQLNDGDKDGGSSSYVEFGPGRQWVQLDLEQSYRIEAIILWHFHGEPRVYRDVVVQVADDPDFITNVQTVFNNDYDNSSGLGIGKDLEYFESRKGELIDTDGATARYVRLYSNGSTASDMNHYTEVEVHGRPCE
jgi:hypothetical protein